MPVTLFCCYRLFLPLIAREIIVDLNVGLEKNDTVSWSMLGFLYGTFPTAPTVVIFAVRYGFEADTVSSTCSNQCKLYKYCILQSNIILYYMIYNTMLIYKNN